MLSSSWWIHWWCRRKFEAEPTKQQMKDIHRHRHGSKKQDARHTYEHRRQHKPTWEGMRPPNFQQQHVSSVKRACAASWRSAMLSHRQTHGPWVEYHDFQAQINSKFSNQMQQQFVLESIPRVTSKQIRCCLVNHKPQEDFLQCAFSKIPIWWHCEESWWNTPLVFSGFLVSISNDLQLRLIGCLNGGKRWSVVILIQMLLLGVSSNRRVFINLCETQDYSENLPETKKTNTQKRQLKGFFKREKLGPFPWEPHLSKTLKHSLALAVFWIVRVPLVSGNEQGLWSRVASTSPWHLGMVSTQTTTGPMQNVIVANEICVLRNKSLPRERKQLTFFLSVYSCKHGRRRSERARRW